jgi:transcriptional regulator with XRE-family HTH domain
MTIGQKINIERMKKGLTLKELSDKSNISSSTINSWIYHDSHPDIYLLSDVADVLGLSLDYLAGRELKNGK